MFPRASQVALLTIASFGPNVAFDLTVLSAWSVFVCGVIRPRHTSIPWMLA